MWMWSFHAFRLLRTDVRIHWSLPAYFLYYVMRSSSVGYGPFTLLMWVVLPMLILFASVVCHEFGHVFAARLYGQRTGSMILTPIGGMVMVAEGPTPKVEFVVAAAGPFVNLGLAIVVGVLYFAAGGAFDLGILLPFGDQSLLATLWRDGAYLHFTLVETTQTNITLFLFNVLLVAYPLDGGRMLFSFLWKRRGRHQGLALACRVAQGLAIAMGVFALVVGRAGLAVIAALVFFQALSTERQLNQIVPPGDFAMRRPPPKARPNVLRRALSQHQQRQRGLARVKEVARHDAEVGPLPDEVMRQVRQAMDIGRATASKPDPEDPTPSA